MLWTSVGGLSHSRTKMPAKQITKNTIAVARRKTIKLPILTATKLRLWRTPWQMKRPQCGRYPNQIEVDNRAAELSAWRREWDSNPRYGFPYTRFPSVRLQPLGHPSGAPLSWREWRDFSSDYGKHLPNQCQAGRGFGHSTRRADFASYLRMRLCFAAKPASWPRPRSLASFAIRPHGEERPKGASRTRRRMLRIEGKGLEGRRPAPRFQSNGPASISGRYSAACANAFRRRHSIRKSVSITSPKLE